MPDHQVAAAVAFRDTAATARGKVLGLVFCKIFYEKVPETYQLKQVARCVQVLDCTGCALSLYGPPFEGY